MSMTLSSFLSLGALVCYLLSALWQWFAINQKQTSQEQNSKQKVLFIGFSAAALHISAIALNVATDHGFNLAFFQVGSLIALVICVLLLISSIKKPVENLFIGLFPMTALFILMSLLFSADEKVTQLSGGLGTHIILSIVSYSILLIAAVQAMFLYWQDQHLRQHQISRFIRAFPPLQTMDTLLFEMIWLGTILLTLSFIFGWPYVEDIKEQQLIHKTALSIVAWLVFVTLLIGRHSFGWRGILASRWAIGGMMILILAYFGSKFALELVLP